MFFLFPNNAVSISQVVPGITTCAAFLFTEGFTVEIDQPTNPIFEIGSFTTFYAFSILPFRAVWIIIVRVSSLSQWITNNTSSIFQSITLITTCTSWFSPFLTISISKCAFSIHKVGSIAAFYTLPIFPLGTVRIRIIWLNFSIPLINYTFSIFQTIPSIAHGTSLLWVKLFTVRVRYCTCSIFKVCSFTAFDTLSKFPLGTVWVSIWIIILRF